MKQMSMRAELLSRSKRLLRMDMTRRSSPTSIHHGEKQRRMQDRLSLAGAKPGRLAVRCQAMGGARAWKRARCDVGNLSGNVHRSRHALNADTIREMHAAFRQGGREAIEKVMRTQPAVFLKLLVLLVPRQMTLDHSGASRR